MAITCTITPELWAKLQARGVVEVRSPTPAGGVVPMPGTLSGITITQRAWFMLPDGQKWHMDDPDFGDSTTELYVTADSDSAKTKYFLRCSGQQQNAAGLLQFTGLPNGNVTLDILAAAAPLEWVKHPDSGEPGKSIGFEWKGGEPGPNYNVVVTSGSVEVDNVTTPATIYTLNRPTAGNYTVTVYDKGGKGDASANNIVQQVAISVPPIPVLYKFNADDFKVVTDNHLTMTVNNNPVTGPIDLYIGDTVVMTCAAGLQFDEQGCYFTTNDTTGFKYFTFNPNRQIATLIMQALTPPAIYQRFVASVRQADVVTGANNIYKVNESIMTKLNKARYKEVASEGGSTLVDYGQFIIGLIQLPFSLDPALVGVTETIDLGNLDTGVTAPKVLADVMRVDLGSIVGPEPYHNLRDYDETTAVLRLPFMDALSIDIDYVIGQTISITYDVSLYDGKTTVNISSTKTGGVVITNKIDLGIAVPYANLDSQSVSNANISIFGNNGVTTPSLIILRKEALLSDGMFTIPIIDEQLLSTQTGYIEVEKVELISGKATRQEKDDIISTLKSGVIIK